MISFRGEGSPFRPSDTGRSKADALRRGSILAVKVLNLINPIGKGTPQLYVRVPQDKQEYRWY